MGIKRRAFLIGGAALAGGGIFALQYGDYAGRRDALALTRADKAGSFTGAVHDRAGEEHDVRVGGLIVNEGQRRPGRLIEFVSHVRRGAGSLAALCNVNTM